MEHANWPKWMLPYDTNSMNSKGMDTWKLVELPAGANIVGSRFVLHYKHDAAHNIASRIARLVTQGFTQAEGINYNGDLLTHGKTFSNPYYCCHCCPQWLELEQMDIDGAYLNAP